MELFSFFSFGASDNAQWKSHKQKRSTKKKSIKEWKEFFLVPFGRSFTRARGVKNERKVEASEMKFFCVFSCGGGGRVRKKWVGENWGVEMMKMNKEKGSFLFFNFSAVFMLSWVGVGHFWKFYVKASYPFESCVPIWSEVVYPFWLEAVFWLEVSYPFD